MADDNQEPDSDRREAVPQDVAAGLPAAPPEPVPSEPLPPPLPLPPLPDQVEPKAVASKDVSQLTQTAAPAPPQQAPPEPTVRRSPPVPEEAEQRPVASPPPPAILPASPEPVGPDVSPPTPPPAPSPNTVALPALDNNLGFDPDTVLQRLQQNRPALDSVSPPAQLASGRKEAERPDAMPQPPIKQQEWQPIIPTTPAPRSLAPALPPVTASPIATISLDASTAATHSPPLPPAPFHPSLPSPESPPDLTEATPRALDDNSGFDADATLEKLQQNRPAMESVSRTDMARRRMTERGEQRAKQRKQRMGQTASDLSAPPTPPDSPEPLQSDGIDSFVEIEGPPPGLKHRRRKDQGQSRSSTPPLTGSPPQQAPNLNAGNSDNNIVGQLLSELRQQTVLLTKIAEKIENVGTYGV